MYRRGSHQIYKGITNYFIKQYDINYPDFFQERTTYRTFEEVISFINVHFFVQESAFRVGNKHNSKVENQRAHRVIAYAMLMNYTLEQTKALFAEHDHLCISLPHLKEERNIFQINLLYRKALSQGIDAPLINEYPDFFILEKNVLTLRREKL